MSRPRVAFSLAALLVLAGCAGGNPLAGGDASAGLNDAPPVYEPPLEDSALLADHVAALRDAGTFTFDGNTTVADSHEASYQRQTLVRVRIADGAVYRTQRPAPVTQLYQFGNGTAYLRVRGEESVNYRRDPAIVRNASDWARRTVRFALLLFEFEHAGVTDRGGDRVHVYRATDASAVNETAVSNMYEAATVHAANATLHVRESGLVPRLAFEYTVGANDQRRTVTTTVAFTELGATDVSPPAWLSAAREQTGNASE